MAKETGPSRRGAGLPGQVANGPEHHCVNVVLLNAVWFPPVAIPNSLPICDVRIVDPYHPARVDAPALPKSLRGRLILSRSEVWNADGTPSRDGEGSTEEASATHLVSSLDGPGTHLTDSVCFHRLISPESLYSIKR